MNRIQYFCIILLYFSAAVGLTELNSIALYGAIPLAFILSFVNSQKGIAGNKSVIKLLILYVWIAVTVTTSIDIDLSMKQMKQILGVVLTIITITNLSTNKKTIPWLYGIYIIIFISIFIYVKTHIWSVAYDMGTSRIGDGLLNTNKIAYYTFFLTCSFFLLGTIKFKATINILFKWLFIAMIPASFMIALLTASRQVLVIQLPLFLLLLYVRYFNGNGTMARNIIIATIIAFIGVVFFADQITEVYDNSYLKERSQTKIKKDGRSFLLKDAVDVGLENPFTGVGPGCFIKANKYGLYSHCSYTELFANDGIIAVILYCWCLFGFIKHAFQRYRQTHSKIFLVFAFIGLIYAFYNIFYVFYIDMWLMGFFVLITCHFRSVNTGLNNTKRLKYCKTI